MKKKTSTNRPTPILPDSFLDLQKTIIEGVGPDAPVVINEAGARQSLTPYRLDLIPAKALLGVGAVLKHGAEKYGEENWRGISVKDHINHALVHAYAWLAGDQSDDHLSHFCCRAMMAYETALSSKEPS